MTRILITLLQKVKEIILLAEKKEDNKSKEKSNKSGKMLANISENKILEKEEVREKKNSGRGKSNKSKKSFLLENINYRLICKGQKHLPQVKVHQLMTIKTLRQLDQEAQFFSKTSI